MSDSQRDIVIIVAWPLARSTMKILVYSILVVFGATRIVLGVSNRDPNGAYCFQFTWLGRFPSAPVNCSTITTVPCILPFKFTEDGSPPNVTHMWNTDNQTAISCSLDPGYACMKYSYFYNNAVINTSHFCGKLIQDQTTAISSGCFTQRVSGHVVEACACRSRPGGMPCNSSIKPSRSTKMIIILTFITMFLCNI